MKGLTLDSGALIGLERNDRDVVLLLLRARQRELHVAVPAGALAQVWRDGRTQVRLARLLGTTGVEVVPLDDMTARAAGQLCGVKRTSDVIDASVVLCARARGHRVATSDPEDLAKLDPKLELITV